MFGGLTDWINILKKTLKYLEEDTGHKAVFICVMWKKNLWYYEFLKSRIFFILIKYSLSL